MIAALRGELAGERAARRTHARRHCHDGLLASGSPLMR
jgi:hypothetical protein